MNPELQTREIVRQGRRLRVYSVRPRKDLARLMLLYPLLTRAGTLRKIK